METVRFKCEQGAFAQRKGNFMEVGILHAATLFPGQGVYLDTGIEISLPDGYIAVVKANQEAVAKGVFVDALVLPGRSRLKIGVLNPTPYGIRLLSREPIALVAVTPTLAGGVIE